MTLKVAAIAEEEITKSFNRARSLLEDNRNRLKEKVKKTVSERKKQIKVEKDAIQLQQTRLVTTLQKATEVVQVGSEYELAQVYLSVKSDLTSLRDMKPALTKSNMDDISFNPTHAGQ